MQVRAVDFVGIAVPDMEKAEQFYGGVLGLQAIGGFEGWREYDAGNVTIAVIKVTDDDVMGGTKSGWKNAVVALAVPDVAAAEAELREKGVTVVWEKAEHPPCFMAMVDDPFGNRLVLHQRKDGTAG